MRIGLAARAVLVLGCMALVRLAPAATPPASASAAAAPSPPAAGASAPASKPIDVNSATQAQLKTLPGIGDAEAKRIVANRPYLSKTDIVFKAGIPEGTYHAIKRRIVAVQKTKPPAKKA